MPDPVGPAGTDATLRSQPALSSAAVATALNDARRELCDDILRGHGGRAALARFSDRFDGLLRQLIVAAPKIDQPVTVVAIGGYGRRQLCLHSDIDLLVLFGGHLGEAEERVVRAILHPLWDLGLVVGHQVREIEEFGKLEVDNPEFLMALVDARPVAGDRELFDRFESAFHHAGTHAHVVGALNALIDERYAQFNDTLYQLEPDVKEAPGALRDLTATRMDCAAHRSVAAASRPRRSARGSTMPRTSCCGCDRSCTSRASATRTMLQPRAAGKGGRHPRLPGALPQQRVERLMSDYFRHARDRHALARVDAQDRAGAGRPNLGRSRDGIGFIDLRQAAVQPATWLGAFQAAIDNECPVSDASARRASSSTSSAIASRISSRRRRSGPRCCSFSSRAPGCTRGCREMHDCGLLGRMFPRFQAITCRVVRDFYHKYTVDEHTLLTIRNLERLDTDETPDRAAVRVDCSADLAAPELLVLALLLHDVGKWRDDDHHARERAHGARDVPAARPRAGAAR